MNRTDEASFKKFPHRKTFASMAATYSMGVFNDNFFKQAAMLLAIGAGLTRLQGTATIVFALPFILFSAYAGWLADRFPKKHIVVNGKILEVIAMAIGAIGIITTNWFCIMSMVFLMGLQSAIFGPALNGSIPEIFQDREVIRVNGLLKMFTTIAVLIGITCAGFALDTNLGIGTLGNQGNLMVAGIILAVSALGLYASFGMTKQAAADPDKPFPWSGPLNSFSNVWELRADPELLLAVLSDAFFYFMATLAILIINSLGILQLGLSQSMTGLLSLALLTGVATGSVVSTKIVDLEHWKKVLIPGTFGMGLSLFAVSVLSDATWHNTTPIILLALAFTGYCGGYFLIPITSFIQIRPAAKDKGQVLAVVGFCSFIGILLAGQIYNFMEKTLNPAEMMKAASIICLCVGTIFAAISLKKRHFLQALTRNTIRFLLSLRYSVEVKGLESLDKNDRSGILFLPNHPALIDPVILMTILHKQYRPRPLADTLQTDRPYIRPFMKLINAISIPVSGNFVRSNKERISKALDTVAAALEQGDNVLLYPAGRLYRGMNEEIGANSAVKTLLDKNPDQKIILIRTSGLWGSSFSWSEGQCPNLIKNWKQYIYFALANLLFFGPRRKVVVEFSEKAALTRSGDKMSINRELELFYNRVSQPNSKTPLYWWQGRDRIEMPEPDDRLNSKNLDNIPVSIQNQVVDYIQNIAGVSEIADSDRLAGDLGLDSLMIMDLAGWLEKEFGMPVHDLESLATVADCILAACGHTGGKSSLGSTKVHPLWFANETDNTLVMPDERNIAHTVLTTARKNPGKAIIADQIIGAKTYRQFILASLILKRKFEKFTESSLGIMLPATTSATITYFSTMFSGKTPVMFNWTMGESHLQQCIDSTGVKRIVTAKALIDKLADQGIDFSSLDVEWLYLEEIKHSISLPEKITAFMKSYLTWHDLSNAAIPNTAAILFTSGSESAPKAVPLSHANILANIRDFNKVLSFKGNDRLLGMLPPFHSLGLSGTIILPLCLGLKTTYHPNPTESANISELIGMYRSTILIGTPTFLNGILGAAREGQLESLRLAFTGAEKCPEYVYKRFSKNLPEATLCEGYGITECSPVVTVNTPEDPQPGTIGRILPSMKYMIIAPDTEEQIGKNKRGVLLVQGDNVFSGYLNGSRKSPFVKINGTEWYNTGDLVMENENGILSFCGRLKRFIKLGGEMISLPAIETVLQEHFPSEEDGTPAMAIESTPSEEHPEIVLFTTIPAEREEINRCIRAAGYSALHNIRKIVNVESIPVLGTGKTDYRQLKSALI